MSEISELIDKQVNELTENVPDIFYNKEGTPPEDENDRKVYFQFNHARAMFALSHPKTDELSSYEYREFVEVMAIKAVSIQYKGKPGKYYFDTVKEICANQLGNWYKVNKLNEELNDCNISLEMYENIDIPREWFKTASGYYRFKSRVNGLIRDCKKLIKDYEDLIAELLQEDNQ